ncbi:MAG TPA: twin-arginine translocation signal domain-containing protein, partial [Nitrolancea sp.]|nr:twin-arginine translocation signal domain-containing protein [Nitrolancea sp.]
MAADEDSRGLRLSRRRLLALASAAAGALAIGQTGTAQTSAPETTASPQVPADPTKVQGAPIS